MRKTKIICTIGPACENVGTLKEMMKVGMNVARFNFSHGTHEEQQRKLELVKQARKELGTTVATMLDTKGPEIRLIDIEGGSATLKEGNELILTTEEVMGSEKRVSITYKNLVKDLKPGDTVLIDDGLIELCVEKIVDTEIRCKVVHGGPISNHKGVNVPGVHLTMPYVSQVDLDDVTFGCKLGFDFLAASFVRCKEDILELRKILEEHGSHMQIIAKIENMEGIRNLDEIIEVSDGIMVARGDMGVEIPFSEVPILQKRMIKKAVMAGKHVITATQMLESMIHNPRPTRAEATDVANAIYDGTTGIMLSGESAAGQYPVEAVRTMAELAERTERDIDYKSRMRRYEDECSNCDDITQSLSRAVCSIAMEIGAAAIMPVTLSGSTARQVSRYKPDCEIIGCAVKARVCRQMNLYWGVTPLEIAEAENTDELFEIAVETALKKGYIKKGDKVVITAGIPLGVSGKTNMIKVIEA